jgi:GT2 family glycosyltransferase
MNVDPSRDLVSIVIVNFNGRELTEECLRSVFAQPYRPIEVIVVDNGSGDGSVQMLRSQFPEVHLVENAQNLGFASANNIGVMHARGRWIALLNNDTEVESDWLPALLHECRKEGTGVVTSRIITEGVPAEYYEMNGSINYLGYNVMRVFDDLSMVFFASGASLLFSRELVRRPFLDEYFLYHEDVYFSWVLRLRGLVVKMAQGSVVRHHGSATTRKQPSRTITFYQERNRLLNALLLFEKGTLVKILPYLLLDAVSKTVVGVFSARKSLMGIVQSYTWCLTHLRWLVGERRRHQLQRTVKDTEILKWMSCRIVDAGGRRASWLNACSRTYTRVVGLAHYE